MWRASPLPQGEWEIAVFFCRSWLASELCLEDSGAAIAGKLNWPNDFGHFNRAL